MEKGALRGALPVSLKPGTEALVVVGDAAVPNCVIRRDD